MDDILGLFINLDRSPERRKACEQMITSAKLWGSYKRLVGVDGLLAIKEYPNQGYTPGKLGCWLSHLKSLEAGLDHERHLHILEDDFIFTPIFESFQKDFNNITKPLGDWDLIFCDIDLAGMNEVFLMKNLIQRVTSLEADNTIGFEDASKLYAAGNSSYVVNHASKQKVFKLMREGFGSGLPNDLYLRKLIREKRLKAFVTLPFVTSVSDDFNQSTILGDISQSNPSIMFATLFRRSLAWGADTRGLLRVFQQRINQLQPIGDRGMIYAQLVAHFVSQDYQNY